MALADTGQAIGAVSEVLQNYLSGLSGNVTIGRPEDVGTPETSTLNLFLYEIQFDPGLRDVVLEEGQPPPLWLVLRYLLTAFDGAEGGIGSDTAEAHRLLGRGMQALYGLSLDAIDQTAIALQDNPERLLLKFEDASVDLLSRVMQGSEEQYRCSIGFEIRPVMIAPVPAAADYTLLVGVNYEAGGAIRTDGGVPVIPVIPSLGPRITAIAPEKLGPGDVLRITGEDLHLSDLAVQLGTATLPITAQTPSQLQVPIDLTQLNAAAMAAGSYPVAVVQTLASGRRRSSNLRVVHLLPVLTAVTVTANANPEVQLNLDLTGYLLGSDTDDMFVALYRQQRTEYLFDQEFVALPTPPTPPLMGRRLQISADPGVATGTYRLILRVNGQQAIASPEVMVP